MENTPFSEQEIRQFRAETKGTADRIHFNNAGASLPPDTVVDTMVRYLQEEERYGGYETEDRYREQLDNTYNLLARLINSGKDEIALTESASMAWCLALNGIDFKEGDEILTSEFEYVTNLLGFLNIQKTAGIQIKVIPNDEQGNFSLPALENAISPQTKLLAMTQIPSGGGGMLPIADIGQLARKHRLLYLVDACQSIGQIPVDVKKIDCDMLSVNGRKFLRGPRGTGFLYVRKEVRDQLKLFFMDGFTAELTSEHSFKVRDDGRRFELYEKSRALNLGLAKAAEYALHAGVDRIWQRVQQLADRLRNSLQNIPGVTVHDQGDQKSGIVTFSVEGFASSEIKKRLLEKQINVSVAGAGATLIYMNRHHLTSIVRASVHYYNTGEEIGRFCDVLRTIVH